jgi:hypothetical protein
VLELSTRSGVALLIPVLAALLACGDGGANQGQHAPGDQPGGVTLGLGDIAVAPNGDFVLFTRDDALAVGWSRSGRVDVLPVERPTRLAFSKQRSVVYVGSTDASHRIVALDVSRRSVLWASPVPTASTRALRLAASGTDAHVVAADADTGRVRILDANTGDTTDEYDVGARIVDLHVLPDNQRVLVVLRHSWQDDVVTTPVVLLSLTGHAQKTIDVPNCADRIAVSSAGDRAFLAPTTCIQPGSGTPADPISILDLTPGTETFVRNLPGFGPVAVSPAGTTAVGFLDRNALDRELFDDESLIPDESTDRFHLMLIDTDSLAYDFVEVGSRLPRFAITPDGNVLLVDSSWTVDVPARLFDVEARAWRFINGAPLLLDNFVITSDSAHAYVIESRFFEGLYDLDIARGESVQIPLSFAPRNINISPSDETLYLRKSDREVCVFSLATRRCETHLSAPTLVAP